MVMTRRMIRLVITFVVITIIFNLILIYGVNLIAVLVKNALIMNFRYAVICLCPIVVPYFILLAYLINNPYEKYSAKKHLLKATQTIENFKGIKIAITGSYAKTSCKEILATILSEKYNVLATPKSFNTPLGISKTAKRLDDSYNVFIAEMGARSKGDIQALAKLVRPQYGVLTGVNNQHLETFKDIENTKDTKFELFENLCGEKKAFFSTDNDASIELSERYEGEKYLAGLSGEDNLVTATDTKGKYYKLVQIQSMTADAERMREEERL
jgi:UDP-N-acetylmuramoyl-tripeptide--D-alanyl-D-alanine ligase